MRHYSQYAKVLGIALVGLWAVLAIHPLDRSDWLLENLLVFVAAPLLIFHGPRLSFDDGTWTCLFLFFALHLLGAHWTYAEVPVGDLFGGRNHFDRVVHFCYGLLMAKPTLDLFAARARPEGIWRWIMPVLFLVSHGVVYEVLEWFAAELFGGGLGTAFLGTQGDEWDAQKDVALASLGAAIGVSVWQLAAMRAAAGRDRLSRGRSAGASAPPRG
jgi:putative membrane protein